MSNRLCQWVPKGENGCSLYLRLRATGKTEHAGLFQGAKVEGCIRYAIAEGEGLEAFQDSCGRRKRGIGAALGLIMGAAWNIDLFIELKFLTSFNNE